MMKLFVWQQVQQFSFGKSLHLKTLLPSEEKPTDIPSNLVGSHILLLPPLGNCVVELFDLSQGQRHHQNELADVVDDLLTGKLFNFR